jgi:hypothetical protein
MRLRNDDGLLIPAEGRLRATSNLLRCEAAAWREVAAVAWVRGQSPIAVLALDSTLHVALKAMMLARWASYAPVAPPGRPDMTPEERTIYCEWFALDAEFDADPSDEEVPDAP